MRRLNWTLTINARMDTSPETIRIGAPTATASRRKRRRKVYLRVELQVLDRMPRSNALMFSIRTYLISMNDLVTNPEWAKRMHRVMKTLPEELIEYKGLTRYHPILLDWLKQFDLEN